MQEPFGRSPKTSHSRCDTRPAKSQFDCYGVVPRKTVMRLVSIAVYILVCATSLQAAATALIPSTAPVGARVLIAGSGLVGASVRFTAQNGAVEATVVHRQERFIEVAVPVAAVSGPVVVLDETGSSTFAFTVAPTRYTGVRTFAGSKNADEFKSLYSVTVAPNGTIYVADAAHHQIRSVTAGGATALIAGSGRPAFADGTGVNASFKAPRGVAYDAGTNTLYVADTGNHAIRCITADGSVTTIIGNGTPGDHDGSDALLKEPTGLALDESGQLYITDTANHKIKRYSNGSTITIAGSIAGFNDGAALAAQFQQPQGIAVLGETIYVADTQNHSIRMIQSGTVSTLAGNAAAGFADGPRNLALFNQPTGVSVTEGGEVFVADTMNHRIRRIGLEVTTVAGSGNPGLLDGPTNIAQFKQPAGLSVSGLLLVADTLNDSVRIIDEALSATGIYPAVGPEAGGNQVRIYGTGFVPGQTTVSVNDTVVTAEVFTSTCLSVVIPPGTGAATLTVHTPRVAATLPEPYTYLPAPRIIAVTPSKGSVAGGQTVVFTGADFHTDSVVRFGPTRAIITSATANELTVLTPEGTGTVVVEVTTPGGTATRDGAYTYYHLPIISSITPDRGVVGTNVTILGENFDVEPGGTAVRFGDVVAAVHEISNSRIVTSVPAGAISGPIIVTTAGGDATSTALTVSRYTALRLDPAQLVLRLGTSGFMRAFATDGSVETEVTESATWHTSDPAIASVSSGTITGASVGSATIHATFMDLTATGTVTVTIGDSLPPDPATIAPPVNPVLPASVGDSTSFLYAGPNPVQFDVTPGVIDSSRAAVVRGRVLDTSERPLSGVHVEVHRNGKYGWTLSRSDGYYDLAVNGGGSLTLSFKKTGFIDAQRTFEVAEDDFTQSDDVILVEQDAVITTISSNGSTLQVARGSVVSDARGSRQATLLFRPGTAATMRLPDGSTRTLPSLQVRVTEYTEGPSGPRAMPADLPAQSGYTYCVELSADEAVAAGATTVEFSKPVVLYVENFLGFPVGGSVPVGYYDRQRAEWIAAPNGRILKIVAVDGGVATIDLNGDGVAESDLALEQYGIDLAERQQLATTYVAGRSLWRVPVTHFTPWDCNWPYGPPLGAKAPKRPRPRSSSEIEGPLCVAGSIIDCNNQSLGEALPINGTPFTLHYQSLRMPGNRDAYQMEIDLSGAELPPNVKRIDLELTVAGKRYTSSFAPQANLRHTFVWDGRDVYGRFVQGRRAVTGRTGYTYDLVYQEPAQFARAFALVSGIPFSTDTRTEITLWQEWRTEVGAYVIRDPRAQGFGGWSLSAHHLYDISKQTVYFGNGSVRYIGGIIETIAGIGSPSFSGDGNPARTAGFNGPGDVALIADGSYFIADGGNMLIRRVDPNGIVSTYAGTRDVWAHGGDNGPATSASFYPSKIALMTDGSLLIADGPNRRIRRIAPDGIITTFAGTGATGTGGDGGLAIHAQFASPEFVAAGPDGSVYVGDRGGTAWNVRKIAPDGRISTLAGKGWASGDGIPASSFRKFAGIGGLTVDRAGNVYVGENWYASNQRVWKIGTDGLIARFAGVGQVGYDGDGGQAVDAQLNGPIDLDSDAAGNIYILEAHSETVRRVTTDGRITTIAGSGYARDYAGDGGPATKARLNMPTGFAVALDGTVTIADTYNHRIRRILAPVIPVANGGSLIPSRDGAEVYVFDHNGRHLATRDALTGVPLLTFGYTGDQVASITDQDGNVTAITRSGTTVSIVPPGGRTTTLTLGAEGFLDSMKNPAGETTRFTYASGGLLTAMQTPKQQTYRFTYDALGLLARDEDPAGGYKELSSTKTPDTKSVVVRSAEGRTETFVASTSSTETRSVWMIGSDGIERRRSTDAKETTINTSPLATVSVTREPDVRFGMQAPLANSTVRLPSGLTATSTHRRSVVLSDEIEPLSVTSLTDQFTINGRPFTTTYDSTARSLQSTTAAGRSLVSTLDSRGRIIASDVPGLARVVTTYDDAGRVATLTSGNRNVIFDYNDHHELTSITDSLSRSVSFEYDAASRVTSQTLPDGRKIRFTYDANGNLLSLTPPGRPAHLFSYTVVDLAESYVPPAVDGSGLNLTRYVWNRDKELTSVIRPDGVALNFGYDGAGRLSSANAPHGTTSFGYDSAGRLASIGAPGGETLNYTWDGFLPTSVTWSGAVNGSVEWVWNGDLRVIEEKVPNTTPVTYGYDADGLLTQAGALTLQRNAANGLLTGTVLGKVTDSWSYNEFGEPLKYEAYVDGTLVFAQQYARDASGRITEKIETRYGTTYSEAYEYDAAGRLTVVKQNGEEISRYTYDANGDRLSHTTPNGTVTATYDGQDRLLTYGDATYTYTANGELRTKTDPSGTTAYDYDVAGNLRSVILPNGDVIEYIIDGQNRRVGKKLNGAFVKGWTYADQLNPIAETDATGTVVTRFVYASRANVPDYVVHAGLTYRIVADQLGSPRYAIDITTGALAESFAFDAFGNAQTSVASDLQPFGFAGGIRESSTGLTRFGARDYDPHTGRWTAKDPIGFDGLDANLYGYVYNDPINEVDPMGLYAVDDLVEDAANFSAGFGDNLTFGLTNVIRDQIGGNEGIDRCSGVYSAGEWTGVATSTAIGAAAGLRAAGAKAAGKEFSHWIPGRVLKNGPSWLSEGFGLSRANGNYVSAAEHALNDPFRYRFMPRAWKAANPINSAIVRQLNRAPKALIGTGAGAAYGGASAGMNTSSCGCP